MIFKDHIDRPSTDVRLNNNYSFNTIRAKTCEIIHLSYDEVSD